MPEPAPTLACFHAHPDDEAIFTGGTIVRAVAAGWRVVLVFATNGEEGSAPAGRSDQTGACRQAEARQAAQLLGAAAVHFLGYRDSGVLDTGANHHPEALAAASVTLAANRLRRILQHEHSVVLTTYDANGIYGHPDHVRVHRIGALAAEGMATEVYESTLSRIELRRLRQELLARGLDNAIWPEPLLTSLGTDGEGLVALDVTAELPAKLAAMAAHASQIADAPAFMGVPAGAFHRLLTTEWYRPARVGEGRFLDLLSPAQRFVNA
jgi:LmbE family N-acetylglucosaminyl deacetylase